jgi:hypothetical protein
MEEQDKVCWLKNEKKIQITQKKWLFGTFGYFLQLVCFHKDTSNILQKDVQRRTFGESSMISILDPVQLRDRVSYIPHYVLNFIEYDFIDFLMIYHKEEERKINSPNKTMQPSSILLKNCGANNLTLLKTFYNNLVKIPYPDIFQ